MYLYGEWGDVASQFSSKIIKLQESFEIVLEIQSVVDLHIIR